MNLFERSKEIILAHQDASGAFVASPSFEHYRYSWFRDGAFIAYSMDLVGERLAAERFYRWCARAIERYRDKALTAIELAAENKPIQRELLLHTRYTVNGEEIQGEWGTHQLDGYGAWLWGVAEHLERWKDPSLLQQWRPTLELIVDYLIPLWKMPNFDCWEEFGDDIHPSTIAAIYGGLNSVKKWMDSSRQQNIEATLFDIAQFIQNRAIIDGHYTKSIGKDEIDASLLWLRVPYRLVDARDDAMRQTVRLIEKKLKVEQGVHRYPQDVYYGGGQWILLSAWLGWFYVESGDKLEANRMLQWVKKQSNDRGELPEQTHARMLAPEHYQSWIDRWGPPACPLLWSHAMHLVLEVKLLES